MVLLHTTYNIANKNSNYLFYCDFYFFSTFLAFYFLIENLRTSRESLSGDAKRRIQAMHYAHRVSEFEGDLIR